MKYILLILIISNTYSYSQDSVRVSKQGNDEVNIGGKMVPVTKNGGYTDLRPLNNNVNYGTDDKDSKVENVPDFNPYEEWDTVHYNDANALSQGDSDNNYTDDDLLEIIIAVSIISFVLGGILFIRKLLK